MPYSGEKESGRARKAIESGGRLARAASKPCRIPGIGRADGITGKFISAVHDDWKAFGSIKTELDATDIYTMRRISPDTLDRLKLADKSSDKK